MLNSVYTIDPLADNRWNDFLRRYTHASVFHTSAWLGAIQQTYGYEPIVFTTSPPGKDLENGIVFCKIDSWLTGKRLVSLPFSDHCEPLVEDRSDRDALFSAIRDSFRTKAWRYVEIRPTRLSNETPPGFRTIETYFLHELDLQPDLDSLFHGFHKDSIQRKIRRAEREGLVYREGRSDSLLDDFSHLRVLTRRRHRIPPQPISLYRNLIQSFGDALKIRVAFKGARAISAILTLRYKDTLVYKFGCSDSRFHNLGGMQFLFWKSIQDAKTEGLSTFDFGRSECRNEGLITFKDRWGTTRSTLNYSRYSSSTSIVRLDQLSSATWERRLMSQVFAHTPNRLLSVVGTLLYKHIG
jgi:hypothetical protein